MRRGRDRRSFGTAFPHLSADGFGLLDVGARGGVHPMFEEIAPFVRAVGFEADAEECERLNRAAEESPYRSLTFLPFALGSGESRGRLHLCRSRGASSLFLPNLRLLERFPDVARFTVERTVEIPVRSLDDLSHGPLASLDGPIDFLKLDTQGSELEILRGARATLGQVLGLEVEVEFARLYAGQPLFCDVDGFLAELGFTLFKLRRVEWVRRTCERDPRSSAGQLMFADALYLRDPIGDARWTPADPRRAEALIALACLYDLHDFALELASSGAFARVVDPENVRRFVLDRARSIHDPFRNVRSLLDAVRVVVRPLLRATPLRDPRRSWSRGDPDFYTRI